MSWVHCNLFLVFLLSNQVVKRGDTIKDNQGNKPFFIQVKRNIAAEDRFRALKLSSVLLLHDIFETETGADIHSQSCSFPALHFHANEMI